MIYTSVNVGKKSKNRNVVRKREREKERERVRERDKERGGCCIPVKAADSLKNHSPNVINSGWVRPRPHYTKTQPREKIESREIIEE